ncbi:hypothetical protein [Streptomyces sp. NPDC056105]|uniref:hypothetical protein n=1 Tax=Streptomyces sp. NPDC056105 TaxID=3345714 RepID=UPI0035E25497
MTENGVFLGATAVAAHGRWSWEPGWAWPEGMHLVEVFAVDAAGVESSGTQAPFAVVNVSAGAGSATYYGQNF